jgi:hypothetical protein
MERNVTAGAEASQPVRYTAELGAVSQIGASGKPNTRQTDKSFLVFFAKKELLPS